MSRFRNRGPGADLEQKAQQILDGAGRRRDGAQTGQRWGHEMLRKSPEQCKREGRGPEEIRVRPRGDSLGTPRSKGVDPKGDRGGA